jgi:hypothetical protein
MLLARLCTINGINLFSNHFPTGSQLTSVALALVIDALDEYDGENDVRGIIQLLADARALRATVTYSAITL